MQHRPFRLVLGACALAAMGAIALACSVVLDWSGYTGGAIESSYDAEVEIGNESPETEGEGAIDAGSDSPVGDDTSAASDTASASEGPDASDEAGDAFPGDAPPPCNRSCGGCCDPAGICLGGQSGPTCGRGGAMCTDCTTSGEQCVNGACAVAPKDSGGRPTCTVALCPHLCVPYWQGACCKTDQTCGCQIVIPPPPSPCL